MTAGEAAEIVADLGLDEFIDTVVAEAPPIPALASDIWCRAVTAAMGNLRGDESS